jgi:hypothetical protein
MMSKEFILHFEGSESMRVILEDREDLLLLLKMRFTNICPKRGLRFYGIPQPSLKEFKMGAVKTGGFDNEPD